MLYRFLNTLPAAGATAAGTGAAAKREKKQTNRARNLSKGTQGKAQPTFFLDYNKTGKNRHYSKRARTHSTNKRTQCQPQIQVGWRAKTKQRDTHFLQNKKCISLCVYNKGTHEGASLVFIN
jgi:hypothetical protein